MTGTTRQSELDALIKDLMLDAYNARNSSPAFSSAEVPELPGTFASGDTLDELLEGLQEAVALNLGDGEHAPAEVSELKLAVPA